MQGITTGDGGGIFINVTISSNSTTVLHIRGGYIIPTQLPAKTTTASRSNPFSLIVALDQIDGRATGELFWDDGRSLNTTEKGQYYLSIFNSSSVSI
ncbi:hypothetical protein LSH36_16g03048 [Paralvinella palmiformis]|uniref:Uncharacterized protein n=1 Tax=Paralvinella palmiformis TaxID=53620 RepID=A0AAD9NH86_9ANNE|nr:hypothetical protein LSH36_16g03048 [Paralvinella palmiformis]